MKKLLLILTRKYPYAFGEPFLESEIAKHKDYQDKIIVLAQDGSAGEAPTRVVPDGIEACITSTGKRKNLRISDWLHMLGQVLFPDSAVKEERMQRKLSLSQKAFLGYFEARTKRTLAESVKQLEKVDFNAYDKITIYSYWLFVNAAVAVGLRDYLRDERGYQGKIVVLSRAHRYDIYEDVNKLNYLPFRNKLLQDMDYIFPCSRNGADYLKNHYSVKGAEIQVAYLGSRDYGLSKEPDEVFHILSVSRVVKVKRLELLIDELSKIDTGGKKVLWTHIGAGVEGKPAYFESVKSYAQEKIKNISFEFLGFMQNTEVYEYYRNNAISVFVNVSASEGLPVSLMEASSFGIPVIATDVGGSAEMIDSERNGFLLQKDFPAGELAQKLEIMLCSSAEETAERRKAARELWEKHYCAETNYDRFVEMVSEL